MRVSGFFLIIASTFAACGPRRVEVAASPPPAPAGRLFGKSCVPSVADRKAKLDAESRGIEIDDFSTSNISGQAAENSSYKRTTGSPRAVIGKPCAESCSGSSGLKAER